MNFIDKTQMQFLKAQNCLIKEQNKQILQGELEQYKTIQKAIRLYGKEKQVYIAIEEMAELTKELIKDKRKFKNRNEIIEEIADVEIMMQQLCLIFKCSEEVVNMRRQKIERLKKRMENESI